MGSQIKINGGEVYSLLNLWISFPETSAASEVFLETVSRSVFLQDNAHAYTVAEINLLII
jgi:hypothetical protein